MVLAGNSHYQYMADKLKKEVSHYSKPYSKQEAGRKLTDEDKTKIAANLHKTVSNKDW